MIYPTDWQVRIAQAICSINPNAEVFVDETTEKITWLNGTAEISMEDIKAKQTELQTKVNNGEDINV
jgi:hypothetical protein|tara:strand:- start:363 stop:563 length:201 start_codon:yes stop_codon:yes gene_type:complete